MDDQEWKSLSVESKLDWLYANLTGIIGFANDLSDRQRAISDRLGALEKASAHNEGR
jgi:hypothetical protein